MTSIYLFSANVDSKARLSTRVKIDLTQTVERKGFTSQSIWHLILESKNARLPSIHRIFKLDKRIRYAQIVSHDGQVVAGGMREGLESLDPPELRAMRIRQFSENRELLNEWASQYGRYSYSVIVFDRIKLFVFPLDDVNTLFVSVASSITRSSLERTLLDFLRSSLV